MGQAASSAAPSDAPPPTELTPAMLQAAQRPPLRCVFYYEAQTVEGEFKLPLVYTKQDENAPGTRLMDLELWLREQFAIPEGCSVFAVAPASELYSPPYPLVMLNSVAGTHLARHKDRDDQTQLPPLHFALVVRSMAILRQPVQRGDDPDSPYCPISAAALAHSEASIARHYARTRFVHNMQRFGFARLEVTAEQARIPQQAFDSVRQWLLGQLQLPVDQRWRGKVDARPETVDDPTVVAKGRFVGFTSDRNRQYLQLRRPLAASGTVWPPAYFADNQLFATEMLELFELLDGLARDCMRAICELMNLDEEWMMHTVLDATAPPPASEDQVTTVDKACQYGASVLRVYNYRNKAGSTNPDDASCAVHADLGLVTVSPCATVPGLQMWNMDRMTWTDVEADAGVLHFSVFAGETLGLMTNGLIKAPLHRVPPIAVESEEQRRMSMPFFLRARPDAVLNPKAAAAQQITCRQFMEEVVFKNRPWRREEKPTNLDY